MLSHTLPDDLPVPMMIIAENTCECLWVNFAAQEWLGASARHLIGKPLEDLLADSQSLCDAGRRCRENFAPVILNGINIRKPGSDGVTAHITAFPTGDNVGLMFLLQGAQPYQNRSDGFAATALGRMLAHEIKNPLAGIDGAAQLLALDIDSEDGLALTDLIRSEIGRIHRLADRMESLGDSDPENIQPINIHALLTKARLILQNSMSGNIAFNENYDPSLPRVTGDEDTLMQALLNLIKNAAESIEVSGKPGKITLETSFRRGVTRKNSVSGKGHQLPIEIRVIDDGPGISGELRSRLFQPFVTNKPAGQGLGLALVSKVASAHGGLVEVQSDPGQTVFSILLPATLSNDTMRQSHEV